MTPYEQGYHTFMKVAADGDNSTGMIAGGATAGLGGLGLSHAMSYVPEITDVGRQGIKDLMGIQMPDYHGMSPGQARNLVEDYARAGHRLMAEPVVQATAARGGAGTTGREFIEKLRTGPVSTIANRAKMPAWTADTADYYIKHYDAFTSSPGDAIEQLIRESDHPSAIPTRHVGEMADDVAKRVGQETIKKLTNYRQLVPPLERALDAAPIVGRVGKGVAALGAGAAGLGLLNKFRED
jgi:hypothetical protein